jgi:hypothetical protein
MFDRSRQPSLLPRCQFSCSDASVFANAPQLNAQEGSWFASDGQTTPKSTTDAYRRGFSWAISKRSANNIEEKGMVSIAQSYRWT